MEKRFLEGYNLYKTDQLHNKKIAEYVGGGIDASQMRVHKKKMLKEMREIEKKHVEEKIKEVEATCGDADWVQYE